MSDNGWEPAVQVQDGGEAQIRSGGGEEKHTLWRERPLTPGHTLLKIPTQDRGKQGFRFLRRKHLPLFIETQKLAEAAHRAERLGLKDSRGGWR